MRGPSTIFWTKSRLEREPGHQPAYRNGGPVDLLAMVVYVLLAFSVLYFPLDGPLFEREEEAKPDSRAEQA
jgi:hypothetical protein